MDQLVVLQARRWLKLCCLASSHLYWFSALTASRIRPETWLYVTVQSLVHFAVRSAISTDNYGDWRITFAFCVTSFQSLTCYRYLKRVTSAYFASLIYDHFKKRKQPSWRYHSDISKGWIAWLSEATKYSSYILSNETGRNNNSSFF